MKHKRSNIVKAVNEILIYYGICIGKLWHVNDVREICEQHKLGELTDSEAIEILEMAVTKSDPKIGITPLILEKVAYHYFHKKAEAALYEVEPQA